MLIPRVVIAGTHSGVGKTTVAIALMAALTEKGLRVQPFKVGPDYINPGFHTLATGFPSRNLDGWMMEEGTVLELFVRSAAKADVAVVEGVMGMYDGYGGREHVGSTAHVAQILRAPVVLVLDGSSMARSAAAVVYGYKNYDPNVLLAGVILNKISGKKHYDMIREAVEGDVKVPVLGYIEEEPSLKMPERHLGLVPSVEREGFDELARRLAESLKKTVHLGKVVEIACSAPVLPKVEARAFPLEKRRTGVRIGVGMDKAFNFYYQDNLDLLSACGAELVFFSPLEDAVLPPGISGVYLGGGFPEVYAERLAENQDMKQALRKAAASGMPIYAECGGLMYLCEEIVDFSGRGYPMVGAIPARVQMQHKLEALGYVIAEVQEDNVLSKKGDILRGHEFHWSRITDIAPINVNLYRLWGGRGPDGRLEGFIINGIAASYVHLHFATCPNVARNFIESCKRYRDALVGQTISQQKPAGTLHLTFN